MEKENEDPKKDQITDYLPDNFLKNLGGAPQKIETPQEMEEKLQEYFTELGHKGIRPTITGMCLSMGFESRQSFYDYEKIPEFSYIIRRARLAIENWYELNVTTQAVTGCIFVLKNMGWKDKSEVDQTVNMRKPPVINVNVKNK